MCSFSFASTAHRNTSSHIPLGFMNHLVNLNEIFGHNIDI